MIEIFEGRIGGGKSLSAVERMLMVWNEGGLVFGNIPIHWDAVKALAFKRWNVELDDRQYTFLTEEQTGEFWKHTPAGTRECPVLIVIDEADVWIGNQNSGVKANPEFFNFLKQSRKHFNDLILITQALKNLATIAARLCQYVWRFRDMERVRIKALGLKWPFKQILQVQYDYDGKTEQDRRFWKKDPELYKLYDTTATYSTFSRLAGFEARKASVKSVCKKCSRLGFRRRRKRCSLLVLAAPVELVSDRWLGACCALPAVPFVLLHLGWL